MGGGGGQSTMAHQSSSMRERGRADVGGAGTVSHLSNPAYPTSQPILTLQGVPPTAVNVISPGWNGHTASGTTPNVGGARPSLI